MIIQFIHPGPEPNVSHKHFNVEGGICNWNNLNHLRKFIRSDGYYMKDGTETKANLCFWGEWEPGSFAEKVPESYSERYPEFIHTNFIPANYDWIINDQPNNVYRLGNKTTRDMMIWNRDVDPFVYGESFLYGICQQSSKTSSKCQAKIPKGGMILFGTTFKNKIGFSAFHMDTCFVVRDYIEFNTKTFRDQNFGHQDNAELYKKLSLSMVFPLGCEDDYIHRLYFGATPSNPSYEGMYSFSPARIYSDNSFFMPLEVHDKNYINDKQTQGVKTNKCFTNNDIFQVKKLWDSIRLQNKEAGNVEAVSFPIPPMGPAVVSYGTIEKSGKLI